tara:strand:+ start:295 stop:516 length:222 start_codon:yes stop_codon:yes gene_type:complete
MNIKSFIFNVIKEFFNSMLFAISIIGPLSLCYFVGINVGKDMGASRLQSEAVSIGFAHYDVNTNGVVYFKWNK